MIKISNKVIADIATSDIRGLLADPARAFPVDDAFRIVDFVNQIQEKSKLYFEQLHGIIRKYNGSVEKNNYINFPDMENREAATIEIQKLNAVLVEIPGEPLQKSSDWPKLTLPEAALLYPLLKADNGN